MTRRIAHERPSRGVSGAGAADPFGKIVSDVFPFDEINRAFKFADEGSAIRVSLRMGSS